MERLKRGLSSLAEHRDGDINEHVGMQRNADCMVPGGLQRADRQADLRLGDGEALLGQFGGDVVVGDRSEQASVNTGFLSQLDGGTAELCALGL